MDVFELQWVSDPQLSPDGQRIVYRRNSFDVMNDDNISRLWIMNFDGSGAEPLTGRDVDESRARWSPDGTRIAFVSKTGHGSEIHVFWVASGKLARITQLERSPSDLAWSPDGRLIAFSRLVPEDPPVLVKAPGKPEGADWAEPPRVTTRLKYERDGSGYIEPGYAHYFVVPADGGAPRQITAGEFHHDGEPAWTPDGKSLLFSANRNDDWEREFNNSEIYRVDIESGEITALTDRKGPDHSPQVSPDGRRVAWLSFEDQVQAHQTTRLHVMNVDGSGKRNLTANLDRDIDAFAWGRNGLFIQFDDQGDTKIARLGLDGSHRVLTGQPGRHDDRPSVRGRFVLGVIERPRRVHARYPLPAGGTGGHRRAGPRRCYPHRLQRGAVRFSRPR